MTSMLTPAHLQLLTEGSAIHPDVITERGPRSLSGYSGKTELKHLTFPDYQQRLPGFLLPVHTTDGQTLQIIWRPDEPRVVTERGKKPKKIKYEQLEHSDVRLDCPPRCRPHLSNPDVPLWITEGLKKGDSLASRVPCVIDVPGVWGFRVPKDVDPQQPLLPDWRYVQLAEREVIIAYDSDVSQPEVAQARDTLARLLTGRGAKVRYCTLPALATGAKQGVDDFFAAGGTLAELEALTHAPDTPPQAYARLIQADTIEEETVQYLWEPYIPRKMATVLDGDPGVGKTGAACLIAASVTRGWTLPDQTGKPSQGGAGPGNVLMVAMEDNLGAVIIPRLKRCQADLSRITFVNEIVDAAGKPRPFTLNDLPLLAEYMGRVQPRFVYIDAIQAVLGAKVDIHRANQVTALLAPLKVLAEQYDCAVVCSRHPAKPGQHVAKVLYRGMGSQAFVGTVRSGLFVEEHPGDDRLSLLVHYKANVHGLGRTMILSKAQGVFEWVGVSRITHRTLAGDGSPGPLPHQRLKAALWLETRLRAATLPASQIYREAEERFDWSQKVIRAAAECIGVTKIQVEADFLWTLPPLNDTTQTSGESGRTGRTGGSGIDSLLKDEMPLEGTGRPSDTPQSTPVHPDTPVYQAPPVYPSAKLNGADAPPVSFSNNLSPLQGTPDCYPPTDAPAPCVFCRGTTFWQNAGGQPICQRCHPQPLNSW
jgi:hypothetical protein